nr:ATP-binding protein [Roseomonas sp. GC11]
MIERCPKSMMIRELLQNAVEAACTAPEGSRRVEFSALEVAGARKLALWNSGTGLTGPELYRMCDIAASIRKETGMDRNFGMGAKVASLPSNQNGMRYRSCRKGSVQEVVIGKYEGVYGRLLRPGADGKPVEVSRVTEAAEAEGRPLDQEWTEVVLLGNAPEQDTVADPYQGQPRSAPRWLPSTIALRFFRFPQGVEVVIRHGATHFARDAGRIIPMADRLATLRDYEAVRLPDGIVLHYAYDPSASLPGTPEEKRSLCALVHRDELYALQTGASWRRDAPNFGISFLARNISVLIELPEDYPVQPEAYREFLRYRNEMQAQAKVADFAGLVAQNIPAWLRGHMAAAMPEAPYAQEATETLQELLQRLDVRRRRPGLKPSLDPKLNPTATDPSLLPPEVVPSLMLLRDPAELADRHLTHRAAAYYPETHQLHINLTYPAVEALAARLRALAAENQEPEAVTRCALTVAERAMVLRIARAIAYGLSKRDQPREWREPHLRLLLSPESLSLAAEDIDSGWAEAEQAMRQALQDVPLVTD